MKAETQLKSIENEAFWMSHYKLQQSSGMILRDYCRHNHLNYDRCRYWLKKLNLPHKRNQQLVSIKLKPNEAVTDQKILCTLNLNNGHCLKIHDATVLAIILERCQ